MRKKGVGKTALLVDFHLIRGVVEVGGLVEEKCLQCLLEEDCVMAEEVSDASYSWLGVTSYVGCYSSFIGGLSLKADLFWDIPPKKSPLSIINVKNSVTLIFSLLSIHTLTRICMKNH